ncbi:hypothetical protein [Nocardia salmonicida]|uniref:hypothetical protein n=1 Tax=Nocardia salmonicida TaxID=53431 RepID=UPI00362CBB97
MSMADEARQLLQQQYCEVGQRVQSLAPITAMIAARTQEFVSTAIELGVPPVQVGDDCTWLAALDVGTNYVGDELLWSVSVLIWPNGSWDYGYYSYDHGTSSYGHTPTQVHRWVPYVNQFVPSGQQLDEAFARALLRLRS